MKNFTYLLAPLLLTGAVWAHSREALEIAQKSRPGPHIRFVSFLHISPNQREDYQKLVTVLLNMTSSRPDLVRFRGDVFRVDLQDLGLSQSGWDLLGGDSHFSIRARVNKKEVVLASPWIPGDLLKRSRTAFPVVRGDYLVQKLMEVYPRLLNMNRLKEFEDRVGADIKKSVKDGVELRSILPVSPISDKPSLIHRYPALYGSLWALYNPTRLDAFTEVGGKVNFYVGTLPNKLPNFFLSDSTGLVQQFAPDWYGSDHWETGRDVRIKFPASCIRCHGVQLRRYEPFLFKNAHFNGDPPETLKRFGPTKRILQDDNNLYDGSLQILVNWNNAQFQQSFSEALQRWNRPLGIMALSRELGLSKEALLKKLHRLENLPAALLLTNQTIRREMADTIIPALLGKP